MATPPTGAIIYGRLSVAKDSMSVDSQLKRSRQWADRERWPIHAVHRDDGVSAMRRNGRVRRRDGWTEAMQDLYDHPGSVLLLWEMARATRDRAVWAALYAACIETGSWIGIDGKLHDPEDPDDAFLLDLKASLSVRESAVIRKRVRDHAKEKAELGKPHGRLPYGYRREYSSETGKMLRQVPHPTQAPIVREMAERIISGESIYSVVKDLNAREVPWPHWSADDAPEPRVRQHPWYTSSVRRMLVSPTYAGLRTYYGTVTPGDWEPLITHEQHQRLVQILEDPGRLTVDSFEVKHLLTGLAVCGICNAVHRVFKNRGLPTYICSRHSCTARKKSAVDEYVTAHILELCSRPDFRSRLGDPKDEQVSAAQKHLDELTAYLESYRAAAKSRRLSVESLIAVESEVLPQIEAARRLARPRHVSSAILELVDAGDVEAAWNAPEFGLARRRQVIRGLVRVVIHKTPFRDRRFDADSIELVPLDGTGRLLGGGDET